MVTLSALLVLSLQHKKPIDTPPIRALYPRIEKLFTAKDWRAVGKMLAPTFLEESPTHKKTGKAAFLKGHASQFAPLEEIKMKITPGDIKIVGNRATVEERYWITAKYKDKTGAHSMRSEGSEMDVWLKTRAGWVAGYVKEHDSSFAVDGKVVQHAP